MGEININHQIHLLKAETRNFKIPLDLIFMSEDKLKKFSKGKGEATKYKNRRGETHTSIDISGHGVGFSMGRVIGIWIHS